MNENVGTTKLLTIDRERSGDGSRSVIAGGSIAVRFGLRSSGVALADSPDGAKQVIFQVTYADGGHQEMCLGFLKSGENKDQVKRVLVDRIVPEFAERLPEWRQKIQIVNYTTLISKSAQILPYLTKDSYEQFLYEHEDRSTDNIDGISTLIDSSSEAGSHITNLQQLPAVVKQLPEATHSLLTEVRNSLSDLLVPSDAQKDDIEGINFQLAYQLHNLALSEKPDAFQLEFASRAKPALQSYAEAIRAEFSEGSNSSLTLKGAVIICDSLFSSKFFRTSLIRDHLVGFEKPIRFVKDPGLLGFLGALAE